MTRLVSLATPDDPRIDAYRVIKERDLVGRGGRFIVEGRTVLDVALSPRNRFALESLLIAESRAEALAPLLAQAPEHVPVYTASQAILDGITGFHIHRGLLGVGLRGQEASAAALLAGLPERALVVVALGITNHDNVGGIMRNAAAFGADAALFDFASCDPLYRKAIRVSVGGSLVVPFAREGSAEALLDLLATNGFELLAFSPSGTTMLKQLVRAPRTALMVGAEGPGLSAAIMARARTVRIPMAGGFDSLNVATAAGIALHHLADI
ncbi:TrmH family RNA methyltransferase [Ancylobacter defluvii]|uniref:RNA methyltransferase n=1 Tax=Ancylobacter defluvii TaxID=1282440 RepID=A0A9W6JZC6_9HYPH|nr:RNA methyltransferase [Ancylobacter defluvii]MBS7589263.1 RNA methyltransferase [Ancylobacter defluvii]GLK84875.1 RNA methyltransferase [Ancylobacter defluvii]